MKLIISIFLTFNFIQSLYSDTNNTYILLIGIENYSDLKYKHTSSSIDIMMLKEILIFKGFTSQDITILTDIDAKKQNILLALSNLFEKVKPGDLVLIYFSGHGEQIEDINHDETEDDYDEAFIPYDAIHLKHSTYLIDDELGIYFSNLTNKIGKNGHLLLLFDTCNSGSFTLAGIVKHSHEHGINTQTNLFKSDLSNDTGNFVAIFSSKSYQISTNLYLPDRILANFNLDAGQNRMGRFTWYLIQGLNTSNHLSNYLELFRKIQKGNLMQQSACLEGDLHSLVLAGRLKSDINLRLLAYEPIKTSAPKNDNRGYKRKSIPSLSFKKRKSNTLFSRKSKK